LVYAGRYRGSPIRADGSGSFGGAVERY
jgi:hypothetical protein